MHGRKLKLSNTMVSLTFVFFIFSTGCELNPSPEQVLIENDLLYEERIVAGNNPLNNPSLFTYSGLQSGLYSWGNALIANIYKTNYINANKEVKTLDAAGVSSATGKIGVLEIGGSNPGILYNGLRTAQLDDNTFGSKLTFINAGLNAMDFSNILKPDSQYWNSVQSLLSENGLTNLQVQVVFCIQDNLKNADVSFNRTAALKTDYIALLNLVRTKYPNCKLFLVGDRGYTGYTTDPRHKEPIGYLNGWAVKLFIQDYSNNLLPQFPFVNWLDYYWANGATARFDGLDYLKADYRSGFIHFTDQKANELGASTHARLKADVGTLNWYK